MSRRSRKNHTKKEELHWKKTTSRGKRSCIEKTIVMPRGRRQSIKRSDNNTKKEKEEHH
jgi:hypothetical protein